MVNKVLAAGVDEAGCGPLAGPVVAAAVILDPGRPVAGLDDSKNLSELRRETLFDIITSRAIATAVAVVEPAIIDRINILQATLEAMRRAVAGLTVSPGQALVDGNRPPQLDCAVQCIVGGDGLEPAISAASIVAKVTRDRLMVELHGEYPGYGFDRHKGYPTKAHLEALTRLGPCPAHRKSFRPVKALDAGCGMRDSGSQL